MQGSPRELLEAHTEASSQSVFVTSTCQMGISLCECQKWKKGQNLAYVLVDQSCPTLCNPWTAAHQAPLSMGFSRQEYWSGLPFPSPGDLPHPGIKPKSLLASSALAGGFFMTVPFGKPYVLSLSVGSDSF